MFLISIHVPREGHDFLCSPIRLPFPISIHVPREGHDQKRENCRQRHHQFQSTCPARGTTIRTRRQAAVVNPFQSTCPARGTTISRRTFGSGQHKFQSTCPARGTTQYSPVLPGLYLISIHVPREGHDVRPAFDSRLMTHFNPRAPRGARRFA